MSAAPHHPQSTEFERIATAALMFMRATEVWIAAARERSVGSETVWVAAVADYPGKPNSAASLDLARPTPLIAHALELVSNERRLLSFPNLSAEPAFARIQEPPHGSLLCAPLVALGKPFVALVVARGRSQDFSEAERQVALLYADQVAMALLASPQQGTSASGVLAKAQLRERDAQLAAMRALTSGLDARAVIASIASEITRVIACDAALIYRADPRAGKLRVVAAQGVPTAVDLAGTEILIQNPRSLAARVARERQSVYNALSTPDGEGSLTGALGQGWLLCEPLLAGTRLLGVVMLARARQFDESEQRALGAFSALAAAALERGELFDRVRAQRDQRAAMFAVASDAFALIDDDRRVAEVNQSFANYLDAPSEELRGRNCCAMLGGSSEAESGSASCLLCHGACKVRACLTGEAVSGPFECEFAAPDHRDARDTTMAPTYGRHVAFTLTPVDGPERRQVLLVGRDITDERMLEKQRLAILRELTHEVRQPLTVARSNLESVLHYSSPDLSLEERQRKERLAVRGIVQASAVVADIQALFERMVGQFTVEPEPGDLAAVARLAADEVESLARHFGVRLVVDAPANLPPAQIDPKRAEQVARNLLINALKFTPTGGAVRISTHVGSGKDAGWVILVVEDTGPGIPHESLPHIFDRYYQAGTPLAEGRPKGSGLGLAVVRYIMQGHLGDHWAENRSHGGARFIMRFPRA